MGLPVRWTRSASACSPFSVLHLFPCVCCPLSIFSPLQIIISPESPVPVRKVLPPLSPPTPRRPPIVEEPKQQLLAQRPLVPVPPPPPPPPSPPPQPKHIQEPVAPTRHIVKLSPPPAPIQEPPSPKSEPHVPALEMLVQPPPVEPVTPVLPKVLVSVGCQTEYDPVFPSMQARTPFSNPTSTKIAFHIRLCCFTTVCFMHIFTSVFNN